MKDIIREKITYLYFSPRDVRKNRVDPIMMMQTCYALSKLGNKVIFIYPYYWRKENCKKKDIWDLYNIPKDSFKICEYPAFLTDKTPVFLSRIIRAFFNILIAFILLLITFFKSNQKFIIISRCPTVSYIYTILLKLFKINKIKLSHEMHAYDNSKIIRKIIQNSDLLFSISNRLIDKIRDNIKVDSKKFVIARMGANISNYQTVIDYEITRRNFGIHKDDFVVTYTGKIYKEQKEIEYLIDCAKILKSFKFIFVGGKKEAVNYYMDEIKSLGISNISFVGFKNPNDTVLYQRVSDILVMYYPSDWILKDFLSPGKMIEYMATGNIIVSVNFEVIREVLEDNINALLVEPDSVKSLAETLYKVYNNREQYVHLGMNSQKDANKYSWDSRALIMTESINRLFNVN